VRTDLVEV